MSIRCHQDGCSSDAGHIVFCTGCGARWNGGEPIPTCHAHVETVRSTVESDHRTVHPDCSIVSFFDGCTACSASDHVSRRRSLRGGHCR